MSQESTMICLDNSEWMRNGDYTPTRLQSQQDAVNLIVQCKLRANPENAVGVLTMANEVRVLSTMTQDNNRLFMKLHSVEPSGECQFVSGIKVAHLALKHRQNRNHKMRIVIFIGSPAAALDKAEMTKLAKKLKKEKVQADVVLFGDCSSEVVDNLTTFVDTLNGREGTGSNLVVVSTGSKLTEALMSSPVLRGEGGAAPAIGGGGLFDIGEADDDPDLALALRVSLEEERARQQGATGGGAEPAAQPVAESNVVDVDMSNMSEDQQLEWALRMSMQDSLPVTTAAPAVASPAAAAAAAEPMSGVQEGSSTAAAAAPQENLDDLMDNPDLLQQIVDQLPDSTNKKDDKDKDSSSSKAEKQ